MNCDLAAPKSNSDSAALGFCHYCLLFRFPCARSHFSATLGFVTKDSIIGGNLDGSVVML